MDRYEDIAPATVAQVEEQLRIGGETEGLTLLILGVALHETDRAAAEELLRFCVRWRSGPLRRAALIGLGHLARRFGAADGVTWILLEACQAEHRSEDQGAASDALDDLRVYVPARAPWEAPVLELRGDVVDDFEGFVTEANRSVFPTYEAAIGRPWSGNLDAFNDILRGGFGTPEDGFIFRWRHAGQCRDALGWPATERWLHEKLERCHPANRERVAIDIERARRREGQTLFDIIVEIIRTHGPGGDEGSDLVLLELIED